MLSRDMSSGYAIEVDVRGLRPPADGGPPTLVLAERGQPAGRQLALPLGLPEAHSLLHELQGQDTPRAEALGVLGDTIAALGAQLTCARLLKDDLGGVIGRLDRHHPERSTRDRH